MYINSSRNKGCVLDPHQGTLWLSGVLLSSTDRLVIDMLHSINRRQFLRGDLGAKRTPIRPPWGLAEAAFIATCNRCGDCVPACPEHVIAIGSGAYPQLDFSHATCSFCAECVGVCPTGALRRHTDTQLPWANKAELTPGCLTLAGIVCRSCGEHCDVGAIHFQLPRNGVAYPRIDAAVCTGCGACIGVCPAQALTLRVGQHIQECISA
jgi:ferredoxin-type protein NapF